MASCNDDLPEALPTSTSGPAPIKRTAAAPKLYRVSAVFGHASSTLVFDGTTEVDISRQAAVVTVERRLTSKWTLQAAVGGILLGTMETGGKYYDFGPGWSAGVSASYRLLDGRGRAPFLLLGGTLAFAGATTRAVKPPNAPEVPYYAGDLRLSVVVGKTFFNALSPYAVGRVFGGPIFWQLQGKDIVGTDAYKFQLGAGLSVSLPMGLDAFVEGVPLGEKALSTGLGLSF